jgi:hypothetical protein
MDNQIILKEGWKTSEFWMHAVSQTIALGLLLFPSNTWVNAVGGLFSILSAGTYSLNRTSLKKYSLFVAKKLAEKNTIPPTSLP